MSLSAKNLPGSKRTRIVCTIGPSCSSVETLRRMIMAGADVFRLNFSHGTHEDHARSIKLVRQISYELSSPFALLGDLSGPKLRLQEIDGGSREIVEGSLITLTSDAADGSDDCFGVNIPGFHKVARRGESILLDDGNFRLSVESITGHAVRCRVLNGGVLKSRKGVNLPDTHLPIPALTEKDLADMEFAIRHGVDVLALSFVRSTADIVKARDAMHRLGGDLPILAKIEKKEAVADLEGIISIADGAMVARGDLGIEVPMEQVPRIQKEIIHICNRMARPVITATQMLESMLTNPRPTRAEVTDIYNAILDGTDAIMLSGETAAGRYPVEAVETMDTVATEAERNLQSWNKGIDWVLEMGEVPTITHVTCNSAVMVAEKLGLDLIIIPTQSGSSALHISRFKPSVPIFACSNKSSTVNMLCLAWGVQSRLMAPLREEELEMSETDALVKAAVRCAMEHDFARAGQRAVVLGAVPFGEGNHTNYIRVIDIE
ncbi:MAG: pyruvate kinase [Candidatus Sumerlaeia bacterium]|nr:pyruvate kinase [Candidatus Sumerlaeia bacterium]